MGSSASDYEVLTSAELAERLKVKESWVIDQSKRCRTHDPIPVFRLGKHRRYRWGSSELNAWLERRAGNNTQQRKAGSPKKRRKDSVRTQQGSLFQSHGVVRAVSRTGCTDRWLDKVGATCQTS